MPIHNSKTKGYNTPNVTTERETPPPIQQGLNEENKKANDCLQGIGPEMPDLGEDETNNKPTLIVIPDNFSFFDEDQRAIKPAAKHQK